MPFSMKEIRRQSHNQRADSRTVARLAWMIFIVVSVLIFLIYKFTAAVEDAGEKLPAIRPDLAPEARQGKIYHKPYFSLSYVEEFEVAEWVSYRLTADMLNRKKYIRDQDFNPDPAITTGSGHYRDYKSSGYRRGHLVPAGDMSWNKAAMDATFLLSNVAPMTEKFNDGIWNELEQDVRDWARKYNEIWVVTGPVFTDPITRIGENEILVPRYFYKAIFTLQNQEPLVIGFLFNQLEDDAGPLTDYIVPLDSIEKATGLDLFSNRYGSWDKEITAEKIKGSTDNWPINRTWFNERMKNKE